MLLYTIAELKLLFRQFIMKTFLISNFTLSMPAQYAYTYDFNVAICFVTCPHFQMCVFTRRTC